MRLKIPCLRNPSQTVGKDEEVSETLSENRVVDNEDTANDAMDPISHQSKSGKSKEKINPTNITTLHDLQDVIDNTTDAMIATNHNLPTFNVSAKEIENITNYSEFNIGIEDWGSPFSFDWTQIAGTGQNSQSVPFLSSSATNQQTYLHQSNRKAWPHLLNQSHLLEHRYARKTSRKSDTTRLTDLVPVNLWSYRTETEIAGEDDMRFELNEESLTRFALEFHNTKFSCLTLQSALIIPTLSTTNESIARYFKEFHPILPVFHLPTVNVNKLRPDLLGMIICIGIIYSDDENKREYSNKFWERCRAMQLVSREGSKSQVRTV
jgi:Fungal specific transcription factor domain